MAVFMEPSSSKSQGMNSLNENRTPLRRAGWVAVVYLIAGFAWIAFSDTLAEAWFPDPKTLSVIQTWKGSFFVLITGVILFLGALALGSMVSAMFIFVKAELFLPIVGGVFVFSVLSSIFQRTFFMFMVWRKGRPIAERYRFFLRSPYHHHLQRLWTYSEKKQDIVSVWVIWQNKLGINPVPEENKLLTPQEVNSRVIWHMHLKSIWLFVLTLIIYFKVR